MSFFDDIGHAFKKAGEAVAGAGETVGRSVVIAGETVGNVVVHPDQVFSSVPYSDQVSSSAPRSAIDPNAGVLQQIDLVVSVGNDTVNRLMSDLWSTGAMNAFNGPVKLASSDVSGFAINGTWGQPELDFDVPNQPGLAWLVTRVMSGSIGHYEGWGANAQVVGTSFQELQMAFRVTLNMPALQADAVSQLPALVQQSLAGRVDFQIQRLMIDFQSASLASLDPRRCTLDGRSIDSGPQAAVQQLMENYFTSIPSDQGALGYSVTTPADPGGGGALHPTAASFSTTPDPARSCLNYLFMTQGRTFGTAQGGFSRVLLPSDWPAAMIVTKTRIIGDLIEGQILATIGSILGAGFAYAGNRTWNLDMSEEYRGREIQNDVVSLYADGSSKQHVQATLSTPGNTSFVVAVVGNGSWSKTLWSRPLGNRLDYGTAWVQTDWSLSVTFLIDADGAFQVLVQPANVHQQSDTHKGEAGKLTDIFTSETQDMLNSVARSARDIEALPLERISMGLSSGLEAAARGLILPGGQTFAFDTIAFDDELNMLIKLRYR